MTLGWDRYVMNLDASIKMPLEKKKNSLYDDDNNNNNINTNRPTVSSQQCAD